MVGKQKRHAGTRRASRDAGSPYILGSTGHPPPTAAPVYMRFKRGGGARNARGTGRARDQYPVPRGCTPNGGIWTCRQAIFGGGGAWGGAATPPSAAFPVARARRSPVLVWGRPCRRGSAARRGPSRRGRAAGGGGALFCAPTPLGPVDNNQTARHHACTARGPQWAPSPPTPADGGVGGASWRPPAGCCQLTETGRRLWPPPFPPPCGRGAGVWCGACESIGWLCRHRVAATLTAKGQGSPAGRGGRLRALGNGMIEFSVNTQRGKYRKPKHGVTPRIDNVDLILG